VLAFLVARFGARDVTRRLGRAAVVAALTTAPACATGDVQPGDLGDRLEIRMPSLTPPAEFVTWYSCFSVTFPVDGPVYLTGFEPRDLDRHAHHYVVQLVDGPTDDDPTQPCNESMWEDMIWAFGRGSRALELPEDVGIRAGDSGLVTFRVQVHYHNPGGDTFTDRGGFDVHLSTAPVEHEAGLIRFGDVSGIAIPPGEPSYEHVAECSAEETRELAQPVTAFASLQHAHGLARSVSGEILGDGPPRDLGAEDPFLGTEFHPIDPVNLFPGDAVETRCEYDSSGRDEVTLGGPGTFDEMCLNFVLVYPEPDGLHACGNPYWD
jgi:hypothetical protein